MVLRIAAKSKLNAHIPVLWVLWFNHVAVSLEIDQAKNSPPLSLSLLATRTHMLIESLGGSTVYADAKLEQSLTGHIGTILHGTSCRYLDSSAPCGRSPWKALQIYIEHEPGFTTESNNVLPVSGTRLGQCKPIGYTGTPLRERLDRSRW